MNSMGRYLIILGAVIAVIGVVMVLAPRIPWLGRLPGDIVIKRKNFIIYFPIVTSIILSIILTLLFNHFRK